MKKALCPFGRNVRLELAVRQMTQAELARRLGIAPQSVARRLSTIKPQRRTIEAWAKAIGCSPHKLWSRYRPIIREERDHEHRTRR